MKTSSPTTQSGFSLVELLIVIGVLLSLISVGFVGANKIQENARVTKLRGDVATVNSAVKIYLASGGTLSDVGNVNALIARLKSQANATDAETLVGFRGAMVDSRLRPVSSDTSMTGLRAVWNHAAMRMELANTGDGAKEFKLDATPSIVVEDGRQSSVRFAKTSNWVWDFTDSTAHRSTPSTGVPTVIVNKPDPTAPPAGKKAELLQPPTFSVPGGTYAFDQFDLPLTLNNPNDPQSSQILYKIGGDSWTVYTGPIVVPPGVQVRTQAMSTDPALWIDSAIDDEFYHVEKLLFSGTSDGSFSGAVGDDGLDVEYGEGGRRFEFGTEFVDGGFDDPNHLTFEGAEFSDIKSNEEFLLGRLVYYNGSTFSGTNATAVTLNLDLELTNPDVSETLDFTFNLESTPNLDFQTEAQNADFVRLGNFLSDFETELNGEEYVLELRFGEHSESGFTTLHEFHVFEGGTASGNIYGKLVPKPQ